MIIIIITIIITANIITSTTTIAVKDQLLTDPKMKEMAEMMGYNNNNNY